MSVCGTGYATGGTAETVRAGRLVLHDGHSITNTFTNKQVDNEAEMTLENNSELKGWRRLCLEKLNR